MIAKKQQNLNRNSSLTVTVTLTFTLSVPLRFKFLFQFTIQLTKKLFKTQRPPRTQRVNASRFLKRVKERVTV